MRTKIYLAALCLPMAFAACTNDDFISEEVDLGSRGEVGVTISATKAAGEADTRLDISGSDFMWEAGVDVIGAAMIDGGATVDGNVLVNYPFTADQSGAVSTFSGKSSVTKGQYFFYYGYQDDLNRGLLNLNVPAQTYVVASDKDSKRQAVGYMKGVSPIINLASGITYANAQSAALDLRFVPLYTLVKVNINSSNIPAGVTPTVTKVTLNGGAGFVSKAAADLVAIQTNAGVVPLKNGAIDADKRDAAVTELAKMVAAGTVYGANYNSGTNDDGTPKTTAKATGAATLKVDGELKLEAGKVTSLYLLAPKGTYSDLTLTVETSEGRYTRDIDQEVTLANAEQPIAANLDFDRANGNVAAVTEFTIASSQDWTDAVTFINEHPTSYVGRTITFNLTANINVASMPNYNLTIKSPDADHKKTITLTGDYTVNEANKNLYTVEHTNWAIASGKTVNINAESEIFSAITNKGTLNINANTSAAITNYATLNVNSDVTMTGAVINGKHYVDSSHPQIAGTMTIADGKVLKMNKNLTNNCGTITVGTGAALAMGNATTLLNKVQAYYCYPILTVKGSLTKQSDATVTVTNQYKVDLFGKLDTDMTGGYVCIENGAVGNGSAKISNATVEVMNVTTFKETQANSLRNFEFDETTITTTVNNSAEFTTAKGMDVINDITLNGGDWTWAATCTNNTSSKAIALTTAEKAYVASISLNGASLKLDAAFDRNLNTAGTSKIKAGSVTAATIAGLSVDGGSLTVEGLKVNTQTQTTPGATASINGNLTVEPGAAMYFAKTTVYQGCSLIVKGNTNSAVAAIFGSITANFSNYGTVESKAGTHTTPASRVAGMVTTPTNQATGTFKGNGESTVDVTVTSSEGE